MTAVELRHPGAAPATPTEERILVVEDNPVHALLIERLLVEQGFPHRVHRAASLEETLRLLDAEGPFEVALLDLNLPDASGTEVVRRVADAAPLTATVVLTGGGDGLLESCVADGAHHYLPKDDLRSATLWRAIDAARAARTVRHSLESAIDERDQAIRESRDLMRIVSHDLRAPLRTARLFADRTALDPERSELWLGKLGETLERMESLVDSLLDFERLGAAAPRPEPILLSSIGTVLAHDLVADLTTSGGRLDWEADGAAVCDPRMLRQVFQNLVGNALTYARPEVPPVVRATSMDLGSIIAVDVTDNGCGMDPADAESAFVPFQRLSTTGHGVGLGLAATRRMLELNEGGIDVLRTEPGRGTTFQVLLRRADPQRARPID